jgi:hypothetical protein
LNRPAAHEAGSDLPNGTRLGGRLDDFIGVLGEPLRSVERASGTAHLFQLRGEGPEASLTVLSDGGRAVHLEWQPARPLRTAIMSRLEMLKRWPEDAETVGTLTLHHYESSMNRARSARLARAIPSEWFVDGNGGPVEPGTFTCVVTRRGWTLSAGGRVIQIGE